VLNGSKPPFNSLNSQRCPGANALRTSQEHSMVLHRHPYGFRPFHCFSLESLSLRREPFALIHFYSDDLHLQSLFSQIRLQEDLIFQSERQAQRAVRKELGWVERHTGLTTIDNAVGKVMARTYEELFAFVCSYRLVDVMVRHEHSDWPCDPIPKIVTIPSAAQFKVRISLSPPVHFWSPF
jgi:hypothetical protein